MSETFEPTHPYWDSAIAKETTVIKKVTQTVYQIELKEDEAKCLVALMSIASLACEPDIIYNRLQAAEDSPLANVYRELKAIFGITDPLDDRLDDMSDDYAEGVARD